MNGILSEDVKVVKKVNEIIFIDGGEPADQMGFYFDHETIDACIETLRQFKAAHTPAEIEYHNRELLKKFGQLAPEDGTVYLMRDDKGRYKIGMVADKDVEGRRKAIARSVPRW